MSLQERTLVIKNFDPDKTTHDLIKELFIQAGPVRNIVLKPDHAFVEYEDVESVGYAKALLDGVSLFGRALWLEPKLKQEKYQKFTRNLNDYIEYDKRQQEIKARERLGQYKNVGEQQVPILTIPSQQDTLNMSFNPLPQLQPIQPFTQQQQYIPPIPVMQQMPMYQPQMHSQFVRAIPTATYQSPPILHTTPIDVVRQQMIQSNPYIHDPLRPAPEGRGYQPWFHDQSFQRSRSFHNVSYDSINDHQPRRVSDRPPDFVKRRR